MPIYEYRCAACDERFEELVRASGDEPRACPACGSSDVARIYSPFATEWKAGNVNWHRLP